MAGSNEFIRACFLLYLRPGGIFMIKVVKERLSRVAEIDHVFSNRFGIFVFHQDPGDKVCDGFHIGFIHAEAGHFNSADAQPAGVIPVLRLILRDKVLVCDDICLGQTVGHFQPTAVLFHPRDDLMTLSVALVRAQHRDPAFIQCLGKRF